MKTKPSLWAAMMTALVLAGCSRVNEPDGEQRIQFTVPGLFQAKVDTKAAEVTSLAEFHVGCVTGTLGVSEVEVWNTTFTSSGGETPVYVSDKYWPGSDLGYKFYASNMPLTPSATGYTVSASNATDVVCAVLADPGYCTTNVLSFEHLFSRLGSVTVEAFPGYTITGVSITMTPKTGGTYNLRTKDWSGITTGTATAIANSTPGTKLNDLYTVPGIYTLTASWTATDSGGNAVSYTNRTVDVELEKGVVNNATITLGGNITVGVSLEEYVYNEDLQNLEPLTFEAMGNGNILWKTNNASWTRTIEYSKDNGETWTSVTSTTSGAAIPVNMGDKILVRGNNTGYSRGEWGDCSDKCSFQSDVNFYVYGNLTDLLAKGHKSMLSDYCFSYLFYGNTYLYSHPTKKIYLPSIGLGEECYNSMFSDCTSLTTAPDLPATCLSSGCYRSMFNGCTSLAAAPAISGKYFANGSCESMFANSGLVAAPTLLPKSLGFACFSQMFAGCTSLEDISECDIYSEIYPVSCFYRMFYNCTSLIDASMLDLSVDDNIGEYSFNEMFMGCTNLQYHPSLYIYSAGKSSFEGMFKGCESLEDCGSIYISGLCQSACFKEMFSGCTNLQVVPYFDVYSLAYQCCYGMFKNCTSLTATPVLPATDLADECYYFMFQGCTSLTTAPELPATTLKSGCYSFIFSGCTSLTTAPELPATTLGSTCYFGMFSGCTSLTTAPELPATTLTSLCYYNMFSGCTSLTTAPELPATTLANSCYSYMFNNCTSLTTAPELPATTLAYSCYSYMFNGCSSLNYIKALFRTLSSTSYTKNWVSGVAATGTFVQADDATWNVTGNSGVPTGWTVYTESQWP